MFFQPARHCGTLLTGQVNAERHFFAVGPQQQPASLPALGFDERNLHPMAIEFESVNPSPVLALDDDTVVVKRDASVAPARCSYKNARYTTRMSKPAKGKTSQAPLSANPREIARTTTAREPRTRNLSPEERELLRRATSVKSAAFSTALQFLQFVPNPVFACPCEGPQDKNPSLFSAANCRTSPHGHGKKAGCGQVVPAPLVNPAKDVSHGQQAQVHRGTSPRLVWREGHDSYQRCRQLLAQSFQIILEEGHGRIDTVRHPSGKRQAATAIASAVSRA